MIDYRVAFRRKEAGAPAQGGRHGATQHACESTAPGHHAFAEKASKVLGLRQRQAAAAQRGMAGCCCMRCSRCIHQLGWKCHPNTVQVMEISSVWNHGLPYGWTGMMAVTRAWVMALEIFS